MIRTGLDLLLDAPEVLVGRRYGLLTHLAAVSSELLPAHLALAKAGMPPQRLFGPEHATAAPSECAAAATDTGHYSSRVTSSTCDWPRPRASA